MESIYNHNISLNEIEILSKMIPGRRIDEKGIYEKSLEEDVMYADLYRLYSIRGNNKQALEFFYKIKDPVLKHFLR